LNRAVVRVGINWCGPRVVVASEKGGEIKATNVDCGGVSELQVLLFHGQDIVEVDRDLSIRDVQWAVQLYKHRYPIPVATGERKGTSIDTNAKVIIANYTLVVAEVIWSQDISVDFTGTRWPPH